MPSSMPYSSRRSSIQVAELELRDGILRCNRDASVFLELHAEADPVR